MKNGKIMVVTACAVGLIIGGIIGFSEIFETSWQQPEQVDNSLSAEIDGDENIRKIDYPYTVMEGSVDENDFSNIISFQEAANIAGEAILYLSGITEHQKTAGELSLIKRRRVIVNNDSEAEKSGVIIKDRYNYLKYYYNLQIDLDLSDEFCPKYLRVGCEVNAETGEIISVTIEDYRKFGQDYFKIEEEFMSESWHNRELSQNEIDNNLDYINQITDVLGWNCEPAAYNMTERGTPYGMTYIIDILMDNNEAYEFMICSENGNMEKDSLISVCLMDYVPEDLIPIN